MNVNPLVSTTSDYDFSAFRPRLNEPFMGPCVSNSARHSCSSYNTGQLWHGRSNPLETNIEIYPFSDGGKFVGREEINLHSVILMHIIFILTMPKKYHRSFIFRTELS